MTPEKKDKKLTRWLLAATIALLLLVLGLQLWQMFGRRSYGDSGSLGPDPVAAPEAPAAEPQAPAAQAPVAESQAPAAEPQAPAAQAPAAPEAPAAPAPASGQPSGGFIGEDAAKSAALSHAGISAADAGYIECELDEDDGRWVYEIEFRAGGVEYDYEISAGDGTVLKAERER